MENKKHPSDTSNKILIDWVSFTSTIIDPWHLIDLLGLNAYPFREVGGAKGFQKRLYFDGISIHHGHSTSKDLVWLEMSGQGCRVFETYGVGDFQILFDFVLENEDTTHLTRLDIACDDMDDHLLDMQRIVEDTRLGFYVHRGESWQVTESNKGSSVVFGSYKSDVLIRIYDKSAERGCDPDFHWVRVELQLRRERAMSFIKEPRLVGETYSGVLVNYLWFAERTKDTNKSRWTIADYWANFLVTTSKIKLYVKPGYEYNLDRCKNYVYNQAGNAIDALIQIQGVDRFVDELRHRDIRPNPKYEDLVYENGGVVYLD